MPLQAALANVVAVILTLVFPIVIAFLARRMLGSPVGWPRSILVGVAILLVGSSFANLAFHETWLGMTAEDSSLTSLTLVLALAMAWAFALGVAALVLLEVVVPTGSIPTPLAVIRNLRRSLRELRRTMTILRIASRHGLTPFLRRSGRASAGGVAPGALVAALEECGPTFVKFGQMLSTRSDLLPDDFIAALARLQSQARPADWNTMRPELEEQLGGPLDEHFLQVDQTPIAAASIAQVHAATLLDGTPVVIKAQRPEARDRVLRDAELIRRIGVILESRTEWGRSLGVAALASGFTESLALELDYTAEFRHSELIRRASMGDDSAITIPAMFADLSTGSVLTMERAAGVPLGEAAPLLASCTRREVAALADRIFEAVMRQTLITGVFHADPHPGNILIGEGGALVLLDFGSVGILDRESRTALARLLTAVDSDDAVGVVDALSLVCTIPNDVDARGLEGAVGRLLTVTRTGVSGGTGLFSELFGIARRHRIAVPPTIASALRSMATLEGTLACLDPAFDIVAAAREVAPRLLHELVTVSSGARGVAATGAAFAGTVARLPRRIGSIATDLDSGAFARRFRPFADPDDRRFLRRLVGDVQRAAVAVALIFASVVLTIIDLGPLVAPSMHLTTFVGLSLGVVAFVLTMHLLVRKFDRRA